MSLSKLKKDNFFPMQEIIKQNIEKCFSEIFHYFFF